MYQRLFALLFLFTAPPRMATSQDTPTGWKTVDQAIAKGLPQSAIEALQPILDTALQQQKYPEWVKAVSTKIILEATIQGNQPQERITRMETVLDTAPAETHAVLRAVLANWYWNFFQQNQWQFLRRTDTDDSTAEDDFMTWPLTRILAHIDQQFQAVLTDAPALQAIPVADYELLLEKGSAPQNYRPTLYDVLAQNALDFYQSGTQAGSRAAYAFDLLAESPIFAEVDLFLAWQPASDDTSAATLRAVQIYQDLLRFHTDNDNPSARLDVDLQRLNFAHNFAVGPTKTARYLSALERFVDSNADHEIAARALHDWASVLHQQGDFVTAMKLATRGLEVFPESVGGRRCFNLIQQIKAKSLSVATERVWNKPAPTIDLQYRNIGKVHLRIVSAPFQIEELGKNHWRHPRLDQDEIAQMLRLPPVKQWQVALAPTDDFQTALHREPAPLEIPPGRYVLLSSVNGDFTAQDNQVNAVEFWVSELALVTTVRVDTGTVEGFVLEANRGQPLLNASVQPWLFSHRRNQAPVAAKPIMTDADGKFQFAVPPQHSVLFVASHKDQTLVTSERLNVFRGRSRSGQVEQTRFFTDRAIYRPGQSVQYKGICFASDQSIDEYRVLPRREINVVLRDVNGQEVSRVRHRTNDFGSFHGSIIPPRGRLLGSMTLAVEGEPAGRISFRVEEYKRPQFRVELEAPSQQARLNQEVTLQGKATAYTGAAVGGAQVRYRVVRSVRYPEWYGRFSWWLPPVAGGQQEMTSGTVTTAADGTFAIVFRALPDLSVDPEGEPTFRYEVSADVTDLAGETRSDTRSVAVGYTALSASLDVADWQVQGQAVKIQVRTRSLDGIGQAATGKLTVYALQQPEKVNRPPLRLPNQHRFPGPSGAAPPTDLSNPLSWELGEVVHQQEVQTNPGGAAHVQFELSAGIYRAKLETQDSFGTPVSAWTQLSVLDLQADRQTVKLPHLFSIQSRSVEPGEQWVAVWGSGYADAAVYVQVEHRGKVLRQFWSEPGQTQLVIRQDIDESMRGGLSVRTIMVHENRAYLRQDLIDVPWTNKELHIQWERFVSKLQPGQQERWTATISGADQEPALAELVATLYDGSLDAFLPHNFPAGFHTFRQERSSAASQFANGWRDLRTIFQDWQLDQRDGSLTYPLLLRQIVANLYGYEFFSRRKLGGGIAEARTPLPRGEFGEAIAEPMMAQSLAFDSVAAEPQAAGEAPMPEEAATTDGGDGQDKPRRPTPIDLDTVSARRNLEETAFFFPHLKTNSDGSLELEFQMPEALTTWRFLGFAHDQKLRSGLLTDTVVTAKDLMIQPNPPRFVREGDQLEFTIRVSNQSPTIQSGVVRLNFNDARTGENVDSELSNQQVDQEFSIRSGQSQTLSWSLTVPDGQSVLTYKAVGSTGRLSDGEEGFLPVLSRKVLVSESLPLPIRGVTTKDFRFEKLLQSGDSDSLRHKLLTVQMVSQPAWYAVMALPYLMEYPHQCSEQTFNRLYANLLSQTIANSDPKVKRIFQQWRNTPTLDSPLEQNQELKSVLLEETPWLRQGRSESESRRNVGILFDENRLRDETTRAWQELAQMQGDDGMWPWFPGGRKNEFISLYITTGFGRLRHLGAEIDVRPAVAALTGLDEWSHEIYQRTNKQEKMTLTRTLALYLYGRSFFLTDQPVADQHLEAFQYWRKQAQQHWLQLADRQSQAHLAIALHRMGDAQTANQIVDSIRQRSVSDDELGMFWRDQERSWWWYHAPIETQAVMIEAFDEVAGDLDAVEACKVWLLKQKQTQAWNSTKATADAVYALLLRGENLLSSDALVEVSLGGQTLQPEDVEAGTGFYQQQFHSGEIHPQQGQITLKKSDPGIAWGSIHWQYLEDIAKVTPHDATPLQLTKRLFVKRNTPEGPQLQAVVGPVQVGDELVVRITLRSDRDMEFLHLKDHRGSGTEPVDVLSRYRFQDGLGYYQSTRDTASHFFIDYLPKGTYVFEYSTRVQLRGNYQTGFAAVQCMYAPEFNSHSESLPLVVQ